MRRVQVRAGTSKLVGGIHNREVLMANRAFQAQALRHASGPVLTIGGDCGVETVPLGFARKRFGPALGVLWFDAHGDLNTPATSPSGAYHGMALRHAFGEGDRDFVLDAPVVSRRVVLAGARALDPGEQAMIDRGLVRHVPIERDYDASWVVDAVIASRAPQFYLHIDLDVLDSHRVRRRHLPRARRSVDQRTGGRHPRRRRDPPDHRGRHHRVRHRQSGPVTGAGAHPAGRRRRPPRPLHRPAGPAHPVPAPRRAVISRPREWLMCPWAAPEPLACG
ncbi:arginase [Kutzneria sp. 744]|nr:arginase [Kutzneria sp. 744]